MRAVVYRDYAQEMTVAQIVPDAGSDGDLGFYGTGVTRCGPNDHYDAAIGEGIASARAIQDYGHQLEAYWESMVITKKRFAELLQEMLDHIPEPKHEPEPPPDPTAGFKIEDEDVQINYSLGGAVEEYLVDPVGNKTDITPFDQGGSLGELKPKKKKRKPDMKTTWMNAYDDIFNKVRGDSHVSIDKAAAIAAGHATEIVRLLLNSK